MIRASAWRVKYRNGNKVRVRIGSMGVHPKNRGRVYPAGVRVKSLITDVISTGFDKDDVEYNCVAVEEPPVDVMISRSSGSSPVEVHSASAHNAANCAKDALLVTCFNPPYNDVRHSLLSHNHMMLAIRAFITDAQWDIPAIDEDDKHITFCDAVGRLSTSAVAESPNGRGLAELINDGVLVDVLSWKMDEEEPDAAGIISEALNSAHQFSMASSEISAVSALNGAIIAMGVERSQSIVYSTVRDKLREELPLIIDDPDFLEVFEFLISTGAGKNSYVSNLFDYTGTFVDSNLRRLRLSAFGVVNKMDATCQWTKIAALKRAYRTKPHNRYCQSPETDWIKVPQSRMHMLEELLRFFHVTCKDMMSKLSAPSQIKIQGNIDCISADSFYKTVTKNPTISDSELRAILLTATRRFTTELGMDDGEARLQQSSKYTEGRALWISWGSEDTVPRVGAAVADVPEVGPVVIEYDEISGVAKNQQVDFGSGHHGTKGCPKPIPLPWRDWAHGTGETMGETEADCATAVAGLHAMHVQVDVVSQPIDVLRFDKGHVGVVATEKVAAGMISFPPVVPKASRVLTKSDHPHAIRLAVVVKNTKSDASAAGDNTTERQRYLFVNPEFSPPVEATGSPAVAGRDADIEWAWSPRGTETMCPFWAVQRLTRKQLDAAASASDEYMERVGVRRRFNVELRPFVMSCVNIATASRGGIVNMTRTLEVPFIVNTVELEDGEHLFLEVHDRVQKAATPKRDWKHAHRQQEITNAREQRRKRTTAT